MLWRRSYDTPPPPIDADDPEFAQTDDPRYADLPADARAAHRVPQGRAWCGCCRTGTTSIVPGPAGRHDRAAWPRTATRCARWSSTWTA